MAPGAILLLLTLFSATGLNDEIKDVRIKDIRLVAAVAGAPIDIDRRPPPPVPEETGREGGTTGATVVALEVEEVRDKDVFEDCKDDDDDEEDVVEGGGGSALVEVSVEVDSIRGTDGGEILLLDDDDEDDVTEFFSSGLINRLGLEDDDDMTTVLGLDSPAGDGLVIRDGWTASIENFEAKIEINDEASSFSLPSLLSLLLVLLLQSLNVSSNASNSSVTTPPCLTIFSRHISSTLLTDAASPCIASRIARVR